MTIYTSIVLFTHYLHLRCYLHKIKNLKATECCLFFIYVSCKRLIFFYFFAKQQEEVAMKLREFTELLIYYSEKNDSPN